MSLASLKAAIKNVLKENVFRSFVQVKYCNIILYSRTNVCCSLSSEYISKMHCTIVHIDITKLLYAIECQFIEYFKFINDLNNNIRASHWPYVSRRCTIKANFAVGILSGDTGDMS